MYRILLFAFSWLLLTGTPLNAQQKKLSPRDSVSLSVDTNTVSINYGRPSMRGRTIMGELVPWNRVWRTGANEATSLSTNFDMVIEGVPLPRGKYTLWTLPSPTGWKWIINKETGQWGTKYDEGQDYARFDARVEHFTEPVETLTISLEATGPTSGKLKLLWEKTEISASFEKNDKIRPVSPPDSAEIRLAGKFAKVNYSRPFMRGRKIWGVVVPMDSVWRTGANAATVLTTETDLYFGNLSVPKGTYTLYSIPSENSFQLIVSKKAPGRAGYDKSQDLIRISMTKSEISNPIDPFRIWFEQKDNKTARLNLGWADRVYITDLSSKE